VLTPVYLGLGSNLEREKNIRSALQQLNAAFCELRVSKVYENEAVGFAGPSFFNLVVAFETERSLAQVVSLCKDIERQHGRATQAPRFSSKTLDIDVLLFGTAIQPAHEGLPQLPRAEIIEQAYVLKPLAELSPYVQHPELKQNFADLWRDFQAKALVHGIIREVSLF